MKKMNRLMESYRALGTSDQHKQNVDISKAFLDIMNGVTENKKNILKESTGGRFLLFGPRGEYSRYAPSARSAVSMAMDENHYYIIKDRKNEDPKKTIRLANKYLPTVAKAIGQLLGRLQKEKPDSDSSRFGFFCIGPDGNIVYKGYAPGTIIPLLEGDEVEAVFLLPLESLGKLSAVSKIVKAGIARVVERKLVSGADSGTANNAEKVEAGFDLTDIKGDVFSKILKSVGLDPDKAVNKDLGWVWQNPKILVITGNNPITGKFGQPGRRDDEVDYASFIGIEGEPSLVKKVYDAIKMNADSIKDEDPTRRQFI